MAEAKHNQPIEDVELDAAEPQPETRDYLEYLGEEPYGTAFLSTHTLPKGDGLWKRAGLTVSKDIVWERDPNGPGVGQKGNRFLVPIEDLPAGVAKELEKLPNYKRVTV